jgi:hypothetical protein
MGMKLSELKKQIKDNIYELLSEESVEEGTYVGVAAVGALQKDPKFAAAKDKATALNTLKAGGSVTLEEEEDDKEPTKAELEKEKVKGAPSKFKVPTDQFEDFKDKLKTLVKKVKDMEKGAERDKKMAALKQFIKKPELIKAFKERDVKIDTGGLIG